MSLSFCHPLGPGVRLLILCTQSLALGTLSPSTLLAIDRMRTISGATEGLDGTVGGSSNLGNRANNSGRKHLPSHLKLDVKDSADLGLVALSAGCWADIFVSGTARAVNIAMLDAFAGATGGIVVRGENLVDPGLRRSFATAISKVPMEFTGNGIPVTVELRSCGLLGIDHVVGSVMAGKVLQYTAEHVYVQRCNSCIIFQRRSIIA